MSDSTAGTITAGEGLSFAPTDPIPSPFPYPSPLFPSHRYGAVTPQFLCHSHLTPSPSVSPDTNTPLNLTVIHVVSVTVTLLLSAATFWTIRKGEDLRGLWEIHEAATALM